MPNLAVAPADVDNGNPITSLGKSLLNSISKIIALVLSIEIERENFIEFGCYLYRASPVIMELMTSKNATSNLTEILQNLSKSVDLAKNLISNCSPDAGPIGDSELQSTFEQLESMIRNIGEGLNLIPTSTYRDQYVDVAAKSISREMREAQFQVNGDQTNKPHKEPESENNLSDVSMLVRRDTDLYPGRIEDSIEGSSTDMPRLVDFLRGIVYNSHENSNTGGQSLKTLPQVAEYMEPLYDTFFCPLTKRVMEDPVTIESGITYERRVITEWFRKSEEGAEDIVCPMTGQRLLSRALSTNIALKTTIDEWKERNENARIKVACAALTLGSSKSMIFEALKDLQQLCRTSQSKANVHNTGIVSILVRYLEYQDRKIRHETMETLRVLVEDDEHGQEIIANTNAIETAMKMLSSDHHSERHAAVSFLLELSKSRTLCERIGSVAGGILMLITMKLGDSADAFTAEKAGEILKNLEQYPENIRFMAENGLLEPLLRNLIEGSEEMQMEMGSYLGEIVLNDDTKLYVAERASASLIKMVHSGNTLTRKSAFKALTQISSHRSNAKTLVESGIVPIMIEELFTRGIYNEPMNSDLEAASILANILELGVILDPDALQVNSRGHRMASDYVVYNIVHMLHNSSPEELNTSLVRILSSLTRSPDATTRIVSVIKENDMSHALIELLNSPKEELNIACAKLLTTLSPHIGHTISDRLCRTRGQPESLIEKLERTQITEKHAIFTNFLAKLPYQNLTLNLALLEKNTVTTILQRFNEVQRGETRTSRFTRPYLEGLVGILVRFTATLYDPQILKMARAHNLTSVFTELLISKQEVMKCRDSQPSV
ncbi:putative U-box domain-containing protein 42 [Acorus calamus]|uniref:RING-type E3 ubiquitin transferase n=1 Tax=Acorus calamus TaxID=4465 RepID=A0AAV9DA66_ACOCL|nr:putative U-box domain-containing protein 42 [Acorus calamus]